MEQMKQITEQGRKIEEGSFGIIDHEIERDHGGHNLTPAQWSVVRRAIHTSGDFEFAKLFKFSDQAIESGITALRNGCTIVTDVTMITAGLSQRRLEPFGCSAHCFISDQQVIDDAKAAGSTRAIVAMRRARDLGLLDGGVVGIGNAPTALLELLRMLEHGEVKPALVVAIPVGFVMAEESKANLMQANAVEYITSVGRKGGSPLVVSTLNALLIEASK